MYESLLLSAWLTPLTAALMAATAIGRWLLPAAVLPALLASILVPVGTVFDLPWLLLGTELALGATDRVFLAFSAVLWLAASGYVALNMEGDRRIGRFRVFFLLAMAGNFGLIVGHDVVSFYLGFTLMGLAAYGLVVHDDSFSARRAGRIYLIMTIVGEVALFSGLVMLVARAGDLRIDFSQVMASASAVELAMLTLAFGIKGGLIGMHFWLPLAHPAAPVAASAVLSGAMIKAALIGLLRYLPLGQQALSELGTLLMLAGIVGILIAWVLGMCQRDPKVVLAYSSIAKMGMVLAAIGAAAAFPGMAPAVVTAVVVFAAHHALAKGALFLGVGVVKASARTWPRWLLLVPAAVLAGAPLTSGVWAKSILKVPLAELPDPWHALFVWVLPVATVGTTLLMARFVYLSHGVAGSHARSGDVAVTPWLGLLAASLSLPLLFGEWVFSWPDLWLILVPALVAAAAARWLPGRFGGVMLQVPPGDMAAPLGRWWRWLRLQLRAAARRLRRGERDLGADGSLADRFAPWRDSAMAVETKLRDGVVAGVLWLGLVGVALLLLARGL